MDGKNSAELIINREFNAPKGRVWRAWTDPERVKRWWGPRDFTTPFAKIDLRVGGCYLYCMRSPDRHDYWSTGIYREIVPYQRIVCTDSFSDKDGNIVPASVYGMKGEWPMELLVTLNFEVFQGKTRLTLRHSGFPPGENADLARASWSQSLDKLETELFTGAAK